MNIHLRIDLVDATYTHFTIFLGDATCGQMHATHEEFNVFSEILDQGVDWWSYISKHTFKRSGFTQAERQAQQVNKSLKQETDSEGLDNSDRK